MRTAPATTRDVAETGETSPGYRDWETVDRCPICGCPTSFVVDSFASVVRCQDCGHRYANPRPTQAEIARAYSMPTAYDDWILSAAPREAMWRRRFQRVLGDRPPGRLLDIGAGIGTFLAIARDQGWSVEGTEVSTTAVAKGQELHRIALRTGFVEAAGLAGPYDAISLWHVIEHLPDPVGTMRFCHGLLAEKGRIILAMPNDGDAALTLTHVGNAIRRSLGRAPTLRYVRLRPGVETHIQHFDSHSIRRLLSRCGFIVESVSVDDASPNRTLKGVASFAVRRLLGRLTPWNFGREMLVIGRRGSVDR